MIRRAAALALLGATLVAPEGTRAAAALIESEGAALRLGGYARTLAGVHEPNLEVAGGFDAPGATRAQGASANVLRLEWAAALGETVSAEVHQRAFLRASGEGSPAGGPALGVGASTAPRRSLDLRGQAYDGDRLQAEHDLDRLVVRARLGAFDVSVGRQAITWGVSELFAVGDPWNPFSPFELDTSQKRGIDAVRVIYSASRALELEAVVADRGSLRDLSGGVRVASYGSIADLHVAAAKQWEELVAFAGASATVGSLKLRGEAVVPYDTERRVATRPRATLGVDWMRPDLTLTLEGHYGGAGAAHREDYAAHLASPLFARGEAYLLGRWYAGAAAGWKVTELLQAALSVVANLQDPSAVLSGAIAYQVSQETELSLGAYRGVGARMLLGPEPRLRSEMGSVGTLYYLALATFF